VRYRALAKPASLPVAGQQLLGTSRPHGDSNITCAMGEGTVEFDPNDAVQEPMSARLEQLAAVLDTREENQVTFAAWTTIRSCESPARVLWSCATVVR